MKRRFLYPCLVALMLVLLALAGCGGQKMEVQLSAQGNLQEDGGVTFSIETNLPDDTALMLTLAGVGEKNTSYRGEMSVTVEQGKVETECFTNSLAPIPEGEYCLEITMPVASAQPESVQKIIGKKGKNLEGELVVESELGKTIETSISFSMPAFSENLTDTERILFDASVATAVIYREISANAASDFSVTKMRYTKAMTNEIVDTIMFVDLEFEFRDNATGEYHSSSKEDAILALDQVGPMPYGFLQDYSDDWEYNRDLFTVTCLTSGHAYTEEELAHVNIALAQMLAWMDKEFPTYGDLLLSTQAG